MGRLMLVILLLKKADLPTVLSAGRLMLVSDVHSAKAPEPVISVTWGRWTLARDVQALKALVPNVVAIGRLTLASALQYWKA